MDEKGGVEQKFLVEGVLRNAETGIQQIVQLPVELPEGFVFLRRQPEDIPILLRSTDPQRKGPLSGKKNGEFFQNSFIFQCFEADLQGDMLGQGKGNGVQINVPVRQPTTAAKFGFEICRKPAADPNVHRHAPYETSRTRGCGL